MARRKDVRAQTRQFLTARRAGLTPAQAALAAYGGRRRGQPARRSRQRRPRP